MACVMTSVMEATQDPESTEVYFKQKEPRANLSGVVETRAGWINQTRLSVGSEAGSKRQSQNLKFVQLAYKQQARSSRGGVREICLPQPACTEREMSTKYKPDL